MGATGSFFLPVNLLQLYEMPTVDPVGIPAYTDRLPIIEVGEVEEVGGLKGLLVYQLTLQHSNLTTFQLYRFFISITASPPAAPAAASLPAVFP